MRGKKKEGIVEEDYEKKHDVEEEKKDEVEEEKEKKKRRECRMKKRDERRYKREGDLSSYMPYRNLIHTKRWKNNCKKSSLNFLSI